MNPDTNQNPAQPSKPANRLSTLTTKLRSRARRLLNNPKRLLLTAGLVLLLLVGLLALTSTNQTKQPPAASRRVEIQITKDGFIPATITVPTGTTITWVNKDNNPHRVASNPHPDHSQTPGLDSKEPIGPEASYSFTATTAGTIHYHDHYQPTTNGTVVVE